MLSRDAEWIWDSWYVVDHGQIHAFYLMVSKDLPHPDLRHINARVGHSVSRDGREWTHLPDALGPSDGDGFDSQAIWTGSIVRDAGRWHLFFTGINKVSQIGIQAVGHAVSDDLVTWTRLDSGPAVRAARPYLVAADSPVASEPFRDPWVFRLDDGWHMTLTATDADGWGTVAHATSPDLGEWTLHSPLVSYSRLDQIEVTQVVQIDDSWHLIFCMQPRDVHRDGVHGSYATYSAPMEGPLGPIDLDRATPLGEGIYAGRVLESAGGWHLFGFVDDGSPEGFTGTICDPLPVTTGPDGLLQLAP